MPQLPVLLLAHPWRRAGDPASEAADTLSDVLNTVRMTGALFFLVDCSAPFVLQAPRAEVFASLVLPRVQHIISYHLITSGRAWGGLVDGPPVQLEAGDVLLVPHGHSYFIGSAPTVRSREALRDSLAFFERWAGGELPTVVTTGGGGSSTGVICGFLGCDVDPFNPLVSTLPAIVRIPRPSSGAEDRLKPLVDFAWRSRDVAVPAAGRSSCASAS